MEPSRSGPMQYHQFIASPAVLLETQNGLCVLNYNPTYRELSAANQMPDALLKKEKLVVALKFVRLKNPLDFSSIQLLKEISDF